MRIKILAAALLFSIALYFAQAGFILKLQENNGEFFVYNYGVSEEDPGHPRLKLLRSREKLDSVVAGGRTQLEKTVLLRAWAHSQWKPWAGTFYYPPWDALEIIDLARRRDNRGFCAQYAIVFVQACLSLGLHARYIDLPGHFLAAVWSDDYDKWVAMDAYKDLHYERNGVPLSGFELSRACRRGEIKGVLKVASSGEKTQVSAEALSVYRQYSILLRNNHLSEPVSVMVNGVKRRIKLAGNYRSYPLVGRDRLYVKDVFLAYRTEGGEIFEDRPYTYDADDFRRDMNQTLFRWAESPKEEGVVKLLLAAENSPSFKTFLVSTDGGAWAPFPEKVGVSLRPGVNEISARILTRDGWLGHPSSLKIFYKPPWIFTRPKRGNLPGSV